MENKQKQIEEIAPRLADASPNNIVTIVRAISLSYGDQYLYDLIVDWDKERNNTVKDEMKDEVITYTEEVLRQLKNKDASISE